MDVKGLGKITVATAGTPVVFSATSLKVVKVIVTFDPADTTSTVYVKDSSNTVIAALVAGNPPLIFCAEGGNRIDLNSLKADASANSKGPYVGYEVS